MLSLGFCLIEEILCPTPIPLKHNLFCVLEQYKESLITRGCNNGVIPWGTVHLSEHELEISSPSVVKAMEVPPKNNSYILFYNSYVLL